MKSSFAYCSWMIHTHQTMFRKQENYSLPNILFCLWLKIGQTNLQTSKYGWLSILRTESFHSQNRLCFAPRGKYKEKNTFDIGIGSDDLSHGRCRDAKSLVKCGLPRQLLLQLPCRIAIKQNRSLGRQRAYCITEDNRNLEARCQPVILTSKQCLEHKLFKNVVTGCAKNLVLTIKSMEKTPGLEEILWS